MPIEVTLTISSTENEVLNLLNKLPAISKLTPSHNYTEEEIFFDIYSIAMITDIYGNVNKISMEDVEYLKQFDNVEIFTPTTLKYPDTIGDFNVNFLRFIKHCSFRAQSKIEIHYSHERGDYLYEVAGWNFNYLPHNLEITEQFFINCLDGNENGEIENSAYLSKYKNGQLIIEDFKGE